MMNSQHKSCSCGLICWLLLWSWALLAEPEKKVTELRFLHFLPEKHVQYSTVISQWVQQIDRDSRGKLKIAIVSPKESGPIKEFIKKIHSGRGDVFYGVHAYYPKKFRLATVLRLPFHMTDAKTASLVAWQLHQTKLQKEFEDIKVLWTFMHGPTHLHTINKPVRNLDDLKGMKIRVPGNIMASTIKKLGGIPVVLPLRKTYAALKDGTVDGVLAPWELMLPFKFNEFCKYHTEIGINATSFLVGMSKQKYELLPAGQKAVIDRNSGEYMSARAGEAYDEEDRRCRAVIKKQGGVIINLPEQELMRWKQKAMPVGDEWLEEMRQQNLPGDEVLSYVVRLWSYLK